MSDAAAEAPPAATRILDLADGMLVLDEAHGWTDAMQELKAAAAVCSPSRFIIARHLRSEDAVASPESYDVKTDPLSVPVVPLSELLKAKVVKKASELSASEVVDTADALISYLAQYCQGTLHASTIDSCVLIHDASLCEGSPLETFVPNLLTLMSVIGQLVDAGEVRDGEEEFSEAFLGTSIGAQYSKQRLADIDWAPLTAAAADKTNPIASRLAFLCALANFLTAVIKTHEAGAIATYDGFVSAREAFATAVATLKNSRADAGAVKPPAAVFHEMGARWNTVSSPQPWADPVSWEAATSYFERVARECSYCLEVFPLRGNVMDVYHSVKQFAARDPAPTLLSRCVVAIFMFHGDRLFGGEIVLLSLFRYFKEHCGAPWLAAVTTRDTPAAVTIATSLAAYLSSVSGAPPADAARMLAMHASGSGAELGRSLINLIHAYLRNRGRCHRVLTNALPNLSGIHQTCANTERNVFLAATPQTVRQHASMLQRHEVMGALALWLLMDTCQSICTLTQRLDLLTAAELPALVWYTQAFESTKSECELALFHTQPVDPNDKRFARLPAVITARTAVERKPDSDLNVMREVSVVLAKANAIATAVQLTRLPQCKLPERSLQTVGMIFNNRFAQMMAATRSVPYITSWEDCIKNMKTLGNEAAADKAVARAVEDFKTVAARAGQSRTANPDATYAAFLRAAEETARKNAVVIGVAVKMQRETTITPHPQFPQVLQFALINPAPAKPATA